MTGNTKVNHSMLTDSYLVRQKRLLNFGLLSKKLLLRLLVAIQCPYVLLSHHLCGFKRTKSLGI
ncbi:hypothetical protein [Enterococcus sp. LJL51]|uniref:hypothetical protein n=1 Tax=Enterococcus sp. LJL51 TaxID=3416656 RepID=UPI003CEB94B8